MSTNKKNNFTIFLARASRACRDFRSPCNPTRLAAGTPCGTAFAYVNKSHNARTRENARARIKSCLRVDETRFISIGCLRSGGACPNTMRNVKICA